MKKSRKIINRMLQICHVYILFFNNVLGQHFEKKKQLYLMNKCPLHENSCLFSCHVKLFFILLWFFEWLDQNLEYKEIVLIILKPILLVFTLCSNFSWCDYLASLLYFFYFNRSKYIANEVNMLKKDWWQVYVWYVNVPVVLTSRSDLDL